MVGLSAWEVGSGEGGDSVIDLLTGKKQRGGARPLPGIMPPQALNEAVGNGGGQANSRTDHGALISTVRATTYADAVRLVRLAWRRSRNWVAGGHGQPGMDDMRPAPNRSHLFLRICLFSGACAASAPERTGYVSTLHIIDLAGASTVGVSEMKRRDSKLSAATGEKAGVGEEGGGMQSCENARSLAALYRLLSELSDLAEADDDPITGPTVAGDGSGYIGALRRKHGPSVATTRQIGRAGGHLLSIRDSHLTRFIGPLLAGNSKTWLLACLREGATHHAESQLTLRSALSHEVLS